MNELLTLKGKNEVHNSCYATIEHIEDVLRNLIRITRKMFYRIENIDNRMAAIELKQHKDRFVEEDTDVRLSE